MAKQTVIDKAADLSAAQELEAAAQATLNQASAAESVAELALQDGATPAEISAEAAAETARIAAEAALATAVTGVATAVAALDVAVAADAGANVLTDHYATVKVRQDFKNDWTNTTRQDWKVDWKVN